MHCRIDYQYAVVQIINPIDDFQVRRADNAVRRKYLHPDMDRKIEHSVLSER